MSKFRSVLTAVTVACLLGSGGAASAMTASPDLKELAGAAQFIVHSRVAKVEYRMSEAGLNGQAPVPHTIVTYDVVRPVRGTAGTASFTLRYIGGTDGQGHFLSPSHVPVFQVGDEDILFVRGNGTAGCALAGCVEGRFRVLNGVLHDGTGAPVLGVEADRVVTGGTVPEEFRRIRFPAPTFDALLKNPEVQQALRQQGLSVDEARRRYAAEAPAAIEMSIVSGGASARDGGGSGQGQAVTAGSQATGRPISADAFIARLGGLQVAGLQGTAFQSVDAQAAIAAPSMAPTAAAKRPKAGLAAARSAADIAEERALPKDDLTITRDKSQR